MLMVVFLWLKFYFIQPISHSSVTDIDCSFDPFVFHLFSYTSNFKAYCPVALMSFVVSTNMFSFFLNAPFLLYLHQLLQTADWKQSTSVAILECWLFCDHFYCFNWQFFCWSHFCFQLGMSNFFLRSEKSLSCIPICIFRFQLVFA